MKQSTISRCFDDLHLRGGSSRKVGSGQEPKVGYMVGIGCETILHDGWDEEEVAMFIGRYIDALLTKDHYLGAWYHKGEVYLDVAKQFVYKKEAMDAARKSMEIAIWDVSSQREVVL